MTFDRYRRVFANRSFRTVWSGFSCSVLGDRMTRVALIWFVYSTTGSARAVGGLLLCYTGPILVGCYSQRASHRVRARTRLPNGAAIVASRRAARAMAKRVPSPHG
jgi:Na+/melibiose symporter-like transporter